MCGFSSDTDTNGELENITLSWITSFMELTIEIPLENVNENVTALHDVDTSNFQALNLSICEVLTFVLWKTDTIRNSSNN